MLSIIPEETHAVLIGTSQFPKDKSLCPLPGVVGNIQDLAALLSDCQIIGIPESNITIILDEVNASTVGDKLAQIAKLATDTLFVYYSGHGLIGRGNAATKLLLAVGDTTQENSSFNALAFETVKEAIERSSASKKILIVDSCFSGRVLPKMSDDTSYIKEKIDIRGAYTIASVSSNEQADAPEGEKYTAFTGKLIEVVQSGVDNQSPVINLEELFQNVKSRLVEAGFLEPQRSAVYDAEKIAIFRNRKFKPEITTSHIFIGDSGDSTIKEYQTTARQFINDSFPSVWKVIDRQEVCFASKPVVEICRKAANSCGIYIALLGSFYGNLYEEEDLSETELELRSALDYKQEVIVFVLPEEAKVQLDMKTIMDQAPLIPKQISLKNYLKNLRLPNLKFHEITSTEELKDILRDALAEIRNKGNRTVDNSESSTLSSPLPEEVSFLGKYNHLSYDRRPVLAYTFNDLDRKLVSYFLTQPQAKAALAQANLLRASELDHFRCLGLLHNNNPALGTYLCFAPRELLIDKFAACSLALCTFDNSRRGEAKASPERITDNLLNLFELGMKFLRERSGLHKTGQIGTESRDDLEIPEIALKEALANALVHRDYENQLDQPTRVDVYPDRVEIISHGRALVNLNQDPEDIISTKRNHTIAEIFRIMQQVELNASGISRIFIAVKRADLPAPKIIESSDELPFVRVVFYRPVKEINPISKQSHDLKISNLKVLKNHAPFQAPPLPNNFIDRPEYTTKIKQSLLSKNRSPERFYRDEKNSYNELEFQCCTILGAAGTGKTVLASAMSYDRDIQSSFSDGILWATLGSSLENNLLFIENWIHALGNYDYQVSTMAEATLSLQKTIADKKALLILDDVISWEQIACFLFKESQCQILITSRELEVQSEERHLIDVMNSEQALELIMNSLDSSRKKSKLVEENARELVKKVGGLPANLAQAAQILKGESI